MPRPLAWLEVATEALLIFLVVFTPWAFGTTQNWSIWTANIASYLVGGILIAKHILRRVHEYEPARWGDTVVVRDASGDLAPPPRPRDALTWTLAGLTVLLLGYILVSALNARAVFDPVLRQFDYLAEPLRWLPHSYDRAATWAAFAQYLAYACVFWGARDWLLQQTEEAQPDEAVPRWTERQPRILVPPRLRRLLWVLCLNATALALVGTLQRADGTNKLLWILASRSNKPADHIFGPWSYRSNAAQYFNLVWPVCLGLWLWLQERAGRMALRPTGRFDGPHLVLLPAAMFIAAAPVVSSSRGGAFVCAAMGVLSTAAILLLSRRKIAASARWITVGSLAAAAALGILAGWSSLKERLARPDIKIPTGMEAGTNDFTLLIRAQLPTEPPEDYWRRLVALSPVGRNATGPRNFSLYITPKGALYANRFGNSLSNFAALTTASGVVSNLAGQSVLISVTRRDGLRLQLNGQTLEATPIFKGVPTNWLDYIPSRYLITGEPGVSEVALLNLSLDDAELKAASELPSLAEVESRLLRPATPRTSAPPGSDAASAPVSAEGFAPGEGTSLEPGRRPTDPTSPWLVFRRTTDPGPLQLHRSLPAGSDSRLRGPIRISMQVWNPNDFALHAVVQADQGPPVDEWIEARGEATVQWIARPPHSGAVRDLQVRFLNPDATEATVFPAGTGVFLRDVQVAPATQFVSRRLTEEIRLLDLSDRMSGRNEYYENASKMLVDYPLWGTGAGAFSSVYQLYMKPGQDWAAYLHNDWLETRLTLGLVGFLLVVAALVTLAARSTLGQGLATPRVIIALLWIALAGCLAHARFDYPFQIYSVAFLFVLLASVLTVLTARHRPGAGS